MPVQLNTAFNYTNKTKNALHITTVNKHVALPKQPNGKRENDCHNKVIDLDQLRLRILMARCELIYIIYGLIFDWAFLVPNGEV